MVLEILFGLMLPPASSTNVYPGIDFQLHASPGHIEYDWVVRPGAGPSQVRMPLAIGARAEVDATGDLLVHHGSLTIRHSRPVAFQDAGGRRVAVESRFVTGDRVIGFEVGAYDDSLPLVIDPVIRFELNIGGGFRYQGPARASNIYATAPAVDVDSAGNIWWGGTRHDAPLNSSLPNTRGWVMKLAPSGSRNLFERHFAGDPVLAIAIERGSGIVNILTTKRIYRLTTDGTEVLSTANDGEYTQMAAGAGAVYLLGQHQIVQLLANGRIGFRRRLIGTTTTAITSDINGVLYAGGYVEEGFNTRSVIIGHATARPLIITRFDAAGNAAASVMLPGLERADSNPMPEGIQSLRLDAAGNVYFSATTSPLFPVSAGSPFAAPAGEEAVTVVGKLSAGFTGLEWATFFPGPALVAVSAGGTAFAVGKTFKPDFPVYKAIFPDDLKTLCAVYTPSGTLPQYLYVCGGGYTPVANFTPSGELAWSTLFPPSLAAAADGEGNLYLTRQGAAISEISPGDNGVDVPRGAIFEAIGFQPGLPAPGGLGSLFVRGLNVPTTVASETPLPAEIEGVSLSGGLPLLGIFNYGDFQQINFQLPQSSDYEMPAGGGVVLHYRGVDTTVYGRTAGPGIAAVLHGDDYAPVSESAPARPGETIVIYSSGLGNTVNPPVAGMPASMDTTSPLRNLFNASVSIGTRTVRPQFAGLAPGTVGMYQVNFTVPADLADGEYVVRLMGARPGGSLVRENPLSSNPVRMVVVGR